MVGESVGRQGFNLGRAEEVSCTWDTGPGRRIRTLNATMRHGIMAHIYARNGSV